MSQSKKCQPIPSFSYQLGSLIAFSMAVCIIFGFLLLVSTQRLIAKDEGYYLMAASQVLAGKQPYLDFFYPQMPLLPYVYAIWLKISGIGWLSARFFSGLIASLLGGLLVYEVKKRWGAWACLLCAFLYAGSNYVFPWYTTITTYAFSTLMLFISYIVITHNSKKFSLLMAGLFFGLSVETRLMFLGLYPFILLWLFFERENKKDFILRVLAFSIGTFIALLPALLLFINHFDQFIYNNLIYHLERSTLPSDKVFGYKWKIFSIIFGLADTQKYVAPQIQVFLWINFLTFLISLVQKKKLDLAFYLSVGFLIINFIPTPNYIQYFAPLLPFLIIGCFILLAKIYQQINKLGWFAKYPFSFIPLTLLAGYLYYIPADYENYTKTGLGVIGIGNEKRAKNWDLNKLAIIANEINRFTAENDTVYSFWPGYLINTHVKSVNGGENHFALQAADNLREDYPYLVKIAAKIAAILKEGSLDAAMPELGTLEERRRNYHIISSKELENLFNDENIKLLVLERREIKRGYLKKNIENSNFVFAEEEPPVVLLKRKEE